jgi:Carboxypeptidase regulatory-like domain/TonB dependent receptor-like, beta-barrel
MIKSPLRALCSCRRSLAYAAVGVLITAAGLHAQELGGAGTIQGTVKDPTGGVMQSVDVKIANVVSGYNRTTTTDADGKFVFRNLPPNPYHITVEAQGFQTLERDVDVRSGVPITVDFSLQLVGASETVQVAGHAEDLLERDPSAHVDIDRSLMDKLPLEATSGLNQIVTLASPGVIADSNGFFHPIGDHAQTQFSIDNQPVTDQQSRVYSNQLSPDAVESMEVITGVAPAEYGDKSSLVVHIVTKSGLDQRRPTGTASFGMGSFSTPTGEASMGAGSHNFGNFLSLTGMRTDRYLDPPELTAMHDTGDNASFFDRLDVHPTERDTIHLNVQVARSSFDVPNTFDQADTGQDQHQKITTLNVAPGYSRVFGSRTLFTANGFVRQDRVTYDPSTDPFSDTPATVSQQRRLTNIGAKLDVSYSAGIHNLKVGGTFSATKLREDFTLGFTDAAVNSPCLDEIGAPVDDPTLTAIAQCQGALTVNPDFNPDLVAFDLTRGGSLFTFNSAGTIKEQAAYVQDEIKAGNATFKVGLRLDHYDGLTSATLAQPRAGVSYAIPGAGTVLRASYGRTLETPYNENLLLSSGVGAEALVGQATPLEPGKRHQMEAGIQQGFGRWVVVDFGYYRKHTDNAYDFGVLFDTPIVFPISWDHSNVSGFTGRVNLVEHRGFSAFTVFGHARAIFSGPGNGGLFLEPAAGEFAIDHDQKFQQTTNLQYVFNKPLGAWAAFSWRYDSGLVAGAVPDYATALTLTPDQQAAIQLFCGSTVATREAPITECSSSDRGAKLLSIPADGTEDDVDNPPRVAPRNLFNIGIGADNLFHSDKTKVRVQFSVINLTNKEALYNFLSTFTGTHFVTPRAYQLQVGVRF